MSCADVLKMSVTQIFPSEPEEIMCRETSARRAYLNLITQFRNAAMGQSTGPQESKIPEFDSNSKFSRCVAWTSSSTSLLNLLFFLWNGENNTYRVTRHAQSDWVLLPVRYLHSGKYLSMPPLWEGNVQNRHTSTGRERWRSKESACPNEHYHYLNTIM